MGENTLVSKANPFHAHMHARDEELQWTSVDCRLMVTLSSGVRLRGKKVRGQYLRGKWQKQWIQMRGERTCLLIC